MNDQLLELNLKMHIDCLESEQLPYVVVLAFLCLLFLLSVCLGYFPLRTAKRER